jgi:hypothetical protein
MKIKLVLVSMAAALVMSANPIAFTATSLTAGGAVTTPAMQKFTSTTTDTCTSGCSFVYEDSTGGGLNGHALFSIVVATNPGLVGLFGNIGVEAGGVVTTGQSFGVGTIADTIPGVREDALVTLPAGIQFVLNDGAGTAASDYFTADITSFDLTSIAVGSFNFNLGGIVNLTNFAYTGANASLIALRNSSPGVLTENFTLGAIASDLHSLFNPTGSPRETGFTMSVNTVPEPRFYGLVLCGLLGLVGITIRRRLSASV